MTLSNVKVVGGPLTLSTLTEIKQVARQLDVRFPIGYEEYVTKLGEGVLGGYFVRIFPPIKVLSETTRWREDLDQNWFWEDSSDLLDKEKATRCVVIGNTGNGDVLVTHPDHFNRILVLPRHETLILVAGEGLWESIEWLCNSGVLTEPFSERDFNPINKP